METNGEGERSDDLAQTFAEVARSLRSETSVTSTLQRIVDLAVATIDGCEHAGVSLVKGGAVTTPAASDQVARTVDGIQDEAGEGPCLDAIRDHEVFETGDLAAEERWPHFAQRTAKETGVASMLSFRLFVNEDTFGALNLYSTAPEAFSDEDRTVGSIFAAHASVALAAAVQQQQMEEALASRDVIGQAKGILMARQHVSADEAFAMLRGASQRLNVKLREVARRVAAEDPAPTRRVAGAGE